MSLATMALPGSIPSAGGGMGISPGSLFKSADERAAYQRILDQAKTGPDFKIKKVKVEIFDLSDKDQREAYEKLWAELLDKSARMEVIVDHHKDLVHRNDGTSYWMKYVEYVEFCDASEGSSTSDGKKGDAK